MPPEREMPQERYHQKKVPLESKMPQESEMPPEKNEWLCDPFDQTPVELGHDSSNEFDRMWI